MSNKASRYGQAGKLIKEAQEYDFSSNDELGAFCKYLSCVKHITGFLSEDAACHRDLLLLNRNGAKSVLVMAKKCLERAEDIFVDMIESKSTMVAAGDHAPPLPTRTKSSDGQFNGTEPTTGRLHSLSPMEEARLKNQKLMAVYQEHLKKRASSLLPQDCNRMNLTMWKKIEENNKIAKIKEKALQQKLHDRTSRINKVPKVKTQLMIEHSVKEICELITAFESGKSNFTALKLSLQQHPDDHTHLYSLVNEVLNTGDHPMSKLLAECQYNICESIKPLAVATAKGGNFPTLSFLPISRHHNDPLPSVSDNRVSPLSCSSSSSTLNGRSHSVPDTSTTSAATRPRLQHVHSTPAPVTGRDSALSQVDEEDDFVTAEVFMATPGDQSSPKSTAIEEADVKQSHNDATLTANNKDSSSLDDDHQSLADAESSEAAYFVLEKPTKLVTTNSVDVVDKISTPAYEEIDEARSHSPLPYEIPAVSRHESCDAYYSNIGSPESSGYTLLSQWTRIKPEDDYTQLDPSTIISPVDDSNLYPQLNCSVHLGKREVLEPLSEKVCLSIKEIVREIHLYLNKMEQVFVTMYHGMNVESNKETCRDLVEKIFFPPIWPNLIQLYRCSNYRQEVTLAVNMRQHINSLPADLSIREQFQLLGSATLPYSAAIEELKKIPEENSPSPKLEILVTMSRRICQAIEEYHLEKGQPHADSSVGVDDMLPIFSYIILRSGLPQMVSECSIMNEFIQEGYLMGEEGFCLTSFQTALRYLTTMSS